MATLRLSPSPLHARHASTATSLSSLSTRQAACASVKIPVPSRQCPCTTLQTVRASDDRFDIGEFGARDPLATELESDFGNKTLGNSDTEHRILVPSKITSVAGLSSRHCAPLAEGTQPYTEPEAREMLKRITGWKLVADPSAPPASPPISLRGEWRVRDDVSAEELVRRVRGAAEAEGRGADISTSVEQGMVVRVELSSKEIGGLSENDFIVAAKVDILKVSDLIKKARFWA